MFKNIASQILGSLSNKMLFTMENLYIIITTVYILNCNVFANNNFRDIWNRLNELKTITKMMQDLRFKFATDFSAIYGDGVVYSCQQFD